MPHVFTYGSLMYDEVWSLVVAGSYEKSTATLAHYIRRAVISEEYPVVFRQAGSPGVAGVIYFNVTEADILRLDEFEGEFYERMQEEVMLEKGGTVLSELYTLKDSYRHIASENEWDADRFERSGMKKFLHNYGGFRRSV